MLIDSHIHVGQFCDKYFSPSIVHTLMEKLSVDFYLVSSTTMCEENYQKVIDEIRELIDLDGEKVLPVMWITPEGLNGNIAWFLESGIKWCCLKVHPFLHKNFWLPDGEKLAEVIDIARELRVPILIHTGDEPCCQCGLYEKVIGNNPDITFILAHGRPLQQAVSLVREYSNAYVDSAFMPVFAMSEFIKNGLSHKLLWGTDMCIPKHFYPEADIYDYYLRKLSAFQKECNEEKFGQVAYLNFSKIFNLITLVAT